ncbi:alpha/beta hydrolase [Heyndrickxia ginsengihumi]|uniref:alpha/beta hydrolase n=1 Tax=Heyndrickxia ginsengihumi TaxID=363870 RepID=UPI001D41A54B|nr:esterase family protein [Heyndrickxia ginsengihumi]MBE6184060.1 esterase family protein [Bacillus sp. (in: firmicutes)]MCM3024581.1 esterase family protein [Heyndrickxia ginsengihumi]
MELQKGTIKEFILKSNELAEEIDIWVYLPATFSSLYKYSLLIAQDGKDYFQLGRIARYADELLANKEIEDIIIVGIPYKNVQDRRRKYHPNGEQNGAYIRFIAHELVPYLDREFPTYNIGMGRTLIGDSLGATVSLMTALTYPNTFGSVILQSPLVNDQVIEKVKKFVQPQLLNIYHTIGKGETEVKTTDGSIQDFITPNRKLHQLLVEKGFSTAYKEFDGTHSWKFWQPDLKAALTYIFKK